MTHNDASPAPEGPGTLLDAALAAEVMVRMLSERGPDASICPSDAARALLPAHWRCAMPAMREVARSLAGAGRVRITQGDATLDPAQEWRGPIRIRRGPLFEAE